jgi:hypothetical protein
MSIATQSLQVVAFSVPSAFRYVALAGLKVRIVIASNGIHVPFGGGGEFLATSRPPNGSLTAVAIELQAGVRIADQPVSASQFTIAINLVAVYFLWRLLRFRPAVLSVANTAVAPLPNEELKPTATPSSLVE